MPVQKKTYKKKTGGKKFYKPRIKRSVFTASQSPVPWTIARQLCYSDTHNLNTTAGAIGYVQYSANGLYDPYITGAGHQPRGFDQYMLLYTNYCVLSSKISCNFVNQDTAATMVGLLSASPTTTVTYTDFNEYDEIGKDKVFILPSPGTNLAMRPYQRSLKASMRKWFNTKNLIQETSYCGDALANPSKQIYYTIGIQAMNKLADPGDILVKVQVEYNVIFFNPRNVGQS